MFLGQTTVESERMELFPNRIFEIRAQRRRPVPARPSRAETGSSGAAGVEMVFGSAVSLLPLQSKPPPSPDAPHLGTCSTVSKDSLGRCPGFERWRPRA